MYNITNIDLTPIFDAFTNWFAVIIVWLKTTNIKIWTFTFSFYDFAVFSAVFIVIFHHFIRFWAGSGAWDELKDSEEVGEYIMTGDYDWWGDD